MIDAVIDRFGLTRMPFGRDLPPGRLHRHADCAEAAARITWAVAGRTIGVVTGEVGTGKTAAVRAAVAALDPAGHNVIYIGNPATGARGIHAHVVTALGGLQVVADVAGGLVAGHALHLVTDGDPLVEGGEHAELDVVPQGRLADQDRGERGR